MRCLTYSLGLMRMVAQEGPLQFHCWLIWVILLQALGLCVAGWCFPCAFHPFLTNELIWNIVLSQWQKHQTFNQFGFTNTPLAKACHMKKSRVKEQGSTLCPCIWSKWLNHMGKDVARSEELEPIRQFITG